VHLDQVVLEGRIAGFEDRFGEGLRWDRILTQQVSHHVLQMRARDDLEPFDERRFTRIHGGHEEPFEPGLLQTASRHQHAIDMTDSAVQRELAEKR